MADPRRDNFPNNFVGDLVPTEHGWVVVPPTCCPDGHAYADARLVSQFGLVYLHNWSASQSVIDVAPARDNKRMTVGVDGCLPAALDRATEGDCPPIWL